MGVGWRGEVAARVRCYPHRGQPSCQRSPTTTRKVVVLPADAGWT